VCCGLFDLCRQIRDFRIFEFEQLLQFIDFLLQYLWYRPRGGRERSVSQLVDQSIGGAPSASAIASAALDVRRLSASNRQFRVPLSTPRAGRGRERGRGQRLCRPLFWARRLSPYAPPPAAALPVCTAHVTCHTRSVAGNGEAMQWAEQRKQCGGVSTHFEAVPFRAAVEGFAAGGGAAAAAAAAAAGSESGSGSASASAGGGAASPAAEEVSGRGVGPVHRH
jgi:hypothetical protein